MAKPVTFIVPAIPHLVQDVTPHIVPALTIPAMRSLGQTCKAWNTYLNEQWKMRGQLVHLAVHLLAECKEPVVRALNCAERMSEFYTLKGVEYFYNNAAKHYAMPRRKTFFTLLHPRLDRQGMHLLKDPFKLKTSATELNCGLVSQRKIYTFLNECVQGLVDGKTPDDDAIPSNNVARQVFIRCMEVIQYLPDGAKCFAFTTLVGLLREHEGFSEKKGIFWTDKSGRSDDFVRVAAQLLPKSLPLKWANTCNAENSNFLRVASLSLRRMPGNSDAFRKALLRLALSVVNSFEASRRYWKKIKTSSSLTNDYRSQFIKEVLTLILNVGEVSPEFKAFCKKRLIEIGYIKRRKAEVLDAQPFPFA
jgi:hypothetical protein